MINYERVAEKIFSIIKGHGHTLSMYKEDGMDTTDAAEARRFFVAKPNYMITLDDETNTIKINKNSDLNLEDLEGIMKQMKNLARENMLNTQVKIFGKEITPKDFAYQARKFKDKQMNGISEASLSRMFGSKKTSYQTLESVKMIVRHRKAVDEEVRGSRSRQISAIFLEQAGERFRFPHNHLAGARAMARHMYEGGNMQDTIGEYIIESVNNLIQLAEFVRYTRTNKLINETSEDVIKIVKENIATLRSEIKGLTGAKSYAKMSENIATRETTVLEEDDIADLQDMFTVHKFDEKFGQTLPLVRKLMNEKAAWRAALLEASKQTIFMKAKEDLAEEDIMEFENPVQQVGYKIGKVAKRMVESGDLSKFVAKVAGKLIEGEKISDFEHTIVRNVMENGKIEENNNDCPHCGEADHDCKCADGKARTNFESIWDSFEHKMKMIEHEDIFAEDGKECVCKGKGFLYGKYGTFDCPRCKRTDTRSLRDKVADAELGTVTEDDWDDDHHAGEVEAGAHSGMPTPDHKECGVCGKGFVPSGHPDDDMCPSCIAEYLGEEGFDDHHVGEVEAGCGMGMPPEDCEGMHIDRNDCPECEGSGLGLDNISDCYLCDGTGKVDYDPGSRQDPFSGKYNVGAEDFEDEDDVNLVARKHWPRGR